MKSKISSTSNILIAIAKANLTKELTYKEVLTEIGDRAFGLILLFFALPSALPFAIIPGMSFIFSIPILFLAVHMIFLKKTLWLPSSLAKRTIPKGSLAKSVEKAVPIIKKIEYFLKPRWKFMTMPFMEVINGIIIACLSLLLMLPVPFSNFIFAILLMTFGLGLIEKDGLLILLGYLGVIIYGSFTYLIIAATIKKLLS